MEATDRLTLASDSPPPSESPPSESPQSRLSDGQRTITVAGKILEAQLCVSDDQLLVVLTDDRPFEETIRLYLLSDDLALLDQLAIEAPYQSLIVKEVAIVADRVIDLIVNDGERFRLQVRDSAIGAVARLKAHATGQRVGQHGFLIVDVAGN